MDTLPPEVGESGQVEVNMMGPPPDIQGEESSASRSRSRRNNRASRRRNSTSHALENNLLFQPPLSSAPPHPGSAPGSGGKNNVQSGSLQRASLKVLDIVRVNKKFRTKRRWQYILSKPGDARTKTECEYLAEWLKARPHLFALFDDVPRQALMHVISEFSLTAMAKEQVLFHQGDEGHNYYMVMAGEMGIHYNPNGLLRTRGRRSLVLDLEQSDAIRRAVEEHEKNLARQRAGEGGEVYESCPPAIPLVSVDVIGQSGHGQFCSTQEKDRFSAVSELAQAEREHEAKLERRSLLRKIDNRTSFKGQLDSDEDGEGDGVDESEDEEEFLLALKEETILFKMARQPQTQDTLRTSGRRPKSRRTSVSRSGVRSRAGVRSRQGKSPSHKRSVEDKMQDQLVPTGNGCGNLVATLGRGRGFGEIALMGDNNIRTATARAVKPCLLLKLSKKGMLHLMKCAPSFGDGEHRAFIRFIQDTFPLSALSLTQQIAIRYQMTRVHHLPGDVLQKQGEEVRSIGFIARGSAQVRAVAQIPVAHNNIPLKLSSGKGKDHVKIESKQTTKEVEVSISVLNTGSMFGDFDCMQKSQGTSFFSYVATTPVLLYLVPAKPFWKNYKGIAITNKLQRLAQAKQDHYLKRLDYINRSEFQIPHSKQTVLSMGAVYTSMQEKNFVIKKRRAPEGLPDMLVHLSYKPPMASKFYSKVEKQEAAKPKTIMAHIKVHQKQQREGSQHGSPTKNVPFRQRLRKAKSTAAIVGGTVQRAAKHQRQSWNENNKSLQKYRRGHMEAYGIRGEYESEKPVKGQRQRVFTLGMLPGLEGMLPTPRLKADSLKERFTQMVTTRPQDTEFHSCVRIPSLHEVQMQAVSATVKNHGRDSLEIHVHEDEAARQQSQFLQAAGDYKQGGLASGQLRVFNARMNRTMQLEKQQELIAQRRDARRGKRA